MVKKINTTNIKKYSNDFIYFIKETYLIRNEINENNLEKYLKMSSVIDNNIDGVKITPLNQIIDEEVKLCIC